MSPRSTTVNTREFRSYVHLAHAQPPGTRAASWHTRSLLAHAQPPGAQPPGTRAASWYTHIPQPRKGTPHILDMYMHMWPHAINVLIRAQAGGGKPTVATR